LTLRRSTAFADEWPVSVVGERLLRRYNGPAMSRLFRTSVALIANYAMVLQLLLLDFALASHAGFDELAVICSGEVPGGHHWGSDNSSLPQRGGACACCALACAAAAPGVIPAATKLASVLLVESQQRLTFQPELGPAQPRHQPHEARGPPLG
jgi:hypothetical protein